MFTNRIIKFRAWDLVNKVMYEPDAICGSHPEKVRQGTAIPSKEALIYKRRKKDHLYFVNYKTFKVAHLDYDYDGTILDRELDDPLMQFTGTYDSLGKEIYEGDRLSCINLDDPEDGKVVFGTALFEDGAYILKFDDCKYEDVLRDVTGEENELKVIGNIFENPDLLSSEARQKPG